MQTLIKIIDLLPTITTETLFGIVAIGALALAFYAIHVIFHTTKGKK